MSLLKAFVTREGFMAYLKSEADRYIAELQKKIDDLENHIGTLKLWYGNAEKALHETEETCANLYKDNDHQKRKRCLAMADKCAETAKRYYYLICLDGSNNPKYDRFPKKMDLWEKWQKRWLALAQKFNEVK